MEIRTVYIHSDKPEENDNSDIRLVTFINGDKKILDIIKEMLMDVY